MELASAQWRTLGAPHRFLKCALELPNAQVSQALSGAEGPDRPAEAAAEPPSEGKGGLKQSTPKGAGVGDDGRPRWRHRPASQRDGQLTSDRGLQPVTNQGLHGRETARPCDTEETVMKGVP